MGCQPLPHAFSAHSRVHHGSLNAAPVDHLADTFWCVCDPSDEQNVKADSGFRDGKTSRQMGSPFMTLVAIQCL